jgi:hypothetical protein
MKIKKIINNSHPCLRHLDMSLSLTKIYSIHWAKIKFPRKSLVAYLWQSKIKSQK